MRTVPLLNTDGQLKSWKSKMRALIKQSGSSQQDIATEMSNIVSKKEGHSVASTAFTASLSRFVNGKDSAFPSWFYQEEARLEPLAQALGLASTQPIWNILTEITEQVVSTDSNWHPAFPEIQALVPPTFQGRTIEQVAAQYTRHVHLSQGSAGRLWIVAQPKMGRKTAARILAEHLSEQMQVTIHLERYASEPGIYIASPRTLQEMPNDLVVYLDKWTLNSLRLLIEKLSQHPSLSSVEHLRLNSFSEIVHSELLGNDPFPEAIIWILRMVVDKGVPESPTETFDFRCGLLWTTAVEQQPTLKQVSEQGWQRFLFAWWIDGFPTMLPVDRAYALLSDVDKNDVHTFNKDEIQKLLFTARSSSKKIREESLQTLEMLIADASPEQKLRCLIDSGLLQQSARQTVQLNNRKVALHFIAQSLLEQEEIVLPYAQYISSSEWFVLLWELTERGLRFSRLRDLLSTQPKWAALDCARSIVLFAAYSKQRVTFADIVPAWSGVCWAEMYAILPVSPLLSHLENSRLLARVSERYADVLPRVSSVQSFERYISADVMALFERRSTVPYRRLPQIAPIQSAPRTMEEWHYWPEKLSGMSGWKALETRARLGEKSSIRLLSEGEALDHPTWRKVPVAVRLLWMGKVSVRQSTFQAFQYMLVESWTEDSTHQHEFLSTAERIGASSVLQWMQQWATPLFIAQYIQNERHLGMLLARCALSFALHFSAVKTLEHWMLDLWQWLCDSRGIKGKFLSWKGRRVLLVDLEAGYLAQEIATLVLFGAEQLHTSGRKGLLFRLYSEASLVQDEATRTWLVQSSKMSLLRLTDEQIIHNWIANPQQQDQDLRRALTINAQLLETAWKADVKGLRRQEILRIAALQQPIPRWAILAAEKEFHSTVVWPYWLPPFRGEVLGLVYEMVSRSTGKDRLWWVRVVHLNQPWPSELIALLKSWMFEEEEPFSWKSRTVHVLSPSSTPRLDVGDIFRLLKERMDLNLKEEWLRKGLIRLWQKCPSGLEHNAMLSLLALLQKMDCHVYIFSDGWQNRFSAFVSYLLPVWLQVTSETELLAALQIPQLGPAARGYLIRCGNTTALLEAERLFLEDGACEILLEIAPHKQIHGLVEQFLSRYPTRRTALLTVLETLSETAFDQSGRLGSLKRRVLLDLSIEKKGNL